MLRDQKRNDHYKNAFEFNKMHFQDKIVLDVGAGTGFLSILAARCGAKKVYACEPTNIAEFARNIIAKTDDGKYVETIKIVKKKIEDCVLDEDIPRVDIIISEWMGFCLLFEGMLDSVLYARDKFLVKGGLMFPERAKLYLAAADDFDEKVK